MIAAFPPIRSIRLYRDAERPFSGQLPAWDHLPDGRMSLSEMINFSLYTFALLLRVLRMEEDNAAFKKRAPASPLIGLLAVAQTGGELSIPNSPTSPDQTTQTNMKETLDWAKVECIKISLEQSMNRIDRIEKKLAWISYGDLETEIRILQETIEDEIQNRFLYAYPQNKVTFFLNIKKDWEIVLKKFKSAEADITSAVDCYASGHNTASVFHLMRITEYGLRALAKERRVSLPKNRPIEWGTWEDILAQIRKAVKQMENRKAGPARSRALEFYLGALGEFEAFKEVYRNHVMHARRSYDEGQAFSVLLHVREFMCRLAAHIDENPKAIRWGLK